MAYTKIPQTNIAGALGKTVSSALGVITTNGNKALDVLEELINGGQKSLIDSKQLINSIQNRATLDASKALDNAIQTVSTVNPGEGTYGDFLQRVTNATTLPVGTDAISQLKDYAKGEIVAQAQKEATAIRERAQKEIDSIVEKNELDMEKIKQEVDKVLAALEATLTTIINAANTLRTSLTALKAAITVAEVAITALKIVLGAMPARWTLVLFTILEKDALEVLEETITLAKEEISSIEAILKSIEDALTPLRDRIRRIRAKLAMYLISGTLSNLSTLDIEVLEDAGLLLESGIDIFDVIQDNYGREPGWANYGTDLEHGNPKIEVPIRSGSIGDEIEIKNYGSGSFIDKYYRWSQEKPEKPITSYPEREGWGKNPRQPSNIKNLWMTSITSLFDGTKFGEYTDPVLVKGGIDEEDQPIPIVSIRVTILDETCLSKQPGVLKTDNWDRVLDGAVNILKELPLSKGLQDKLVTLWNIEITQKPESAVSGSTKIKYVTKNGEVYYLEIVEDERSPKVAMRRFVKATDIAGVVVFEGLKTFSTDKESLIKEAELQLELLTR